MSAVKSAIWQKREETGLSRERVAAKLDPPVSSKTIERWEHETTPAPAWRIRQLEQLYATVVGEAA